MQLAHISHSITVTFKHYNFIAANCYEKFVIITNFYPLYENTNAPLKITNMSAIIHVLYYDHSRTCYMHVLCSSTTARAYVRTCT